jgi:ABC-type oligopeptide transport system substrate-binding subunit
MSGGYRLSPTSPTELVLEANDRYWGADRRSERSHLVTDLGGRSLSRLQAGEVDYTPISRSTPRGSPMTRGWGPPLREVAVLFVTYFGFGHEPPAVRRARVRRAFAAAVDWRRLAALRANGDTTPANSMVPPGIPGRSDADWLPKHDDSAARSLLADAGYPAGRGFPAVTMITSGTGFEEAIVTELHDSLGIDIAYESLGGDDYIIRLEDDPPAIWSLSWVADYPGPNDFLGLLLASGRTANYGRWSSPAFDTAIVDALAATDPAVARLAFDRAETIVRDEAPVVPLVYGTGWALSADGLLGAGQNGLSIIRLAGLAWSD